MDLYNIVYDIFTCIPLLVTAETLGFLFFVCSPCNRQVAISYHEIMLINCTSLIGGIELVNILFWFEKSYNNFIWYVPPPVDFNCFLWNLPQSTSFNVVEACSKLCWREQRRPVRISSQPCSVCAHACAERLIMINTCTVCYTPTHTHTLSHKDRVVKLIYMYVRMNICVFRQPVHDIHWCSTNNALFSRKHKKSNKRII